MAEEWFEKENKEEEITLEDENEMKSLLNEYK